MRMMRVTHIKVDERSAQVVLMTQEIGVCNITTTSALHPQPFIWLRMVVRRILVNFYQDYPHHFRLTLNGHHIDDDDDNENNNNDNEHLLF